MALSSAQQSSRLFKKAFGLAETLTARAFFEEANIGQSLVLPSQIWAEADSIPKPAPVLSNGAIDGVVQYYDKLELTHIAGSTDRAYSDVRLKDSLDFTVDPSYNFKLYKNDGTTVIADGESDWLVDREAGVLTFYGLTLPTGVNAAAPPKITFYKYVGVKGLQTNGATSGINVKDPVIAASLVNIANYSNTISGFTSLPADIDGITVFNNADRFLIKDQTDKKQNGIFQVSGTTLVRATDSDGNPVGEVGINDYTFVTSGATLIATSWVIGTTDAVDANVVTPGVDTQDWKLFSQSKEYTADGLGLKILNGNSFYVDLDATGAYGSGLEQGVDGLRVIPSILSEISGATSGMVSVSTAISTLNSTDVVLSTEISSEVSNRISGDASLSTLLSTDVSSINVSISTETSNRISADASLSTVISVIDASLSANLSSDSSLSSGISTEISAEASARLSGDESLSTLLSNEVSTLVSADGSLSTLISTLDVRISTNQSSDISLSTQISTELSTETSARLSSDESLSTQISILEASLSTNMSGDTSLSTAVSLELSTEISNRISGDVSLSTELSNEVSNRISGDASLSTVISALEASLSANLSVDESLSNAISTEISSVISGVVSDDASLSTQISALESMIISGDTSLSNAISAETSARISADESLSTAISAATIIDGSGLTYSGNTLNVNVDGFTIKIVGDEIRGQQAWIQNSMLVNITGGTSGFTGISLDHDPVTPAFAYVNGIEYLIAPSTAAQTNFPFYYSAYPPSQGTQIGFNASIAGFDLETGIDLVTIKFSYIDIA